MMQTNTALFGYETYVSDLRARYGEPCGRYPAGKCPAGTDSADRPSVIGIKDDTPWKRGLNAIVPVSFAVTGGFLFAAAYPAFSAVLAEFLREYGAEPFSAQALHALDDAMREPLAASGYRRNQFPERYAFSCLLRSMDSPPDLSVSGLRLLAPEDAELENRTSMKLSDCIARIAAAVIRDGAVLCIASVNSANGAGVCREIGVECTPAFRGRGFGSACVSLLARTLAARGEIPLYQHYCTNQASAHTAVRAGFAEAGRFYAYTAFHR